MGTFIKVHFGSHALLNDALGLGKNSVSRWYNDDPRRFFMYIQQLKKFSNVSLEDLVEMIEQRVEDVDALKSW